MWLMLQLEKPEDLVIATGEMASVREFTELAFAEVGTKIEWRGEGLEEKGFDAKSGKTLVEVDPVYFRPAEVMELKGDASKAKRLLGWEPKVKLPDLVKKMVAYDMEYDDYGGRE
jgi:GDPmannose 4,6-dehydratase